MIPTVDPRTTTLAELLATHDAVLLDAYGVLVDGAGALPDAPPLIAELNRRGTPYAITGGGTVRFYFDVNGNKAYDAGVDWALFVTGYSEVALARLADGDLSRARIEGHGGRSVSAAMYRMHYMLTSQEVPA